MNTSIIATLLIPFAGTLIGSAFVFFMKKEMPVLLQKALLGFASGVMVAASVWSLLIPSMEMSAGEGICTVLPAAIGFIAGMGFLLAVDYLTPHLHIGDESPEGLKARISKTAMLALAVTIHNIPEGMAVGVVIAGSLQDGIGIAPAAAMATAIGIAIQNIPEGAIITARASIAVLEIGSGDPSGLIDAPDPAVFPRLRRRRDALCRCRRVDSRSLSRPALQHQHHRFRHRLRPDDGPRCRARVIHVLFLSASQDNTFGRICHTESQYASQ